jgi:hypothetical protein
MIFVNKFCLLFYKKYSNLIFNMLNIFSIINYFNELSIFQILIIELPQAPASRRPSGKITNALTISFSPLIILTILPVFKFHNLIFQSPEQLI